MRLGNPGIGLSDLILHGKQRVLVVAAAVALLEHRLEVVAGIVGVCCGFGDPSLRLHGLVVVAVGLVVVVHQVGVVAPLVAFGCPVVVADVVLC